MSDDFGDRLTKWFRIGAERAGPAGSPMYLKSYILGDIKGRLKLNRRDSSILILRTPTADDIDVYVKALSDVKYDMSHGFGRINAFSKEEIELFRFEMEEALSSYKRSNLKFVIPNYRDAIERLDKIFGNDWRKSRDIFIHSIRGHAESPYALRAAGRGEEALRVLGAFVSITQSADFKKSESNFSDSEWRDIDACILGTASWTLYQYGLSSDFGKIIFIVRRYPKDDFFRWYELYIWPGYKKTNPRAMIDAFLHILSGTKTEVESYGNRRGISATDHHNLAFSLRSAPGFKEDKDMKFEGETIRGHYTKAFNMSLEEHSAAADDSDKIYALEDAITSLVARASYEIHVGLVHEAEATLGAAEEFMEGREGLYTYRRAAFLRERAKLYFILSGGNINSKYFDLMKRDLQEEAMIKHKSKIL